MKYLMFLLTIIPLKAFAIGCIGEWPNEICANPVPSRNSPASEQDENEVLVIDFYNLAINQHQPAEAAERYIGKKYIQHNPLIADGKQAFTDFFIDRFRKFPNLHGEIKRVMADRDLVILHVHSKTDRNDRGRAIVDIFRVEEKKIVEHWDVIQTIPDHAENSNGMF